MPGREGEGAGEGAGDAACEGAGDSAGEITGEGTGEGAAALRRLLSDGGIASVLEAIQARGGAPRVRQLKLVDLGTLGDAARGSLCSLLSSGALPALQSIRLDVNCGATLAQLLLALRAPRAPPVSSLAAWDYPDALAAITAHLTCTRWPRHLSRLELPAWRRPHSGMRAFVRALCSLDCTGIATGDAVGGALYGCALRTVVFCECELSLFSLLPSSTDRSLDLSGSHLNGDDLTFIFEMLRAGGAPQLVDLDLSAGDLEPEVASVLSHRLHAGDAPQLRSINVLGSLTADAESWTPPLVRELVVAADARGLSLCGPLAEGPTSRKVRDVYQIHSATSSLTAH